MPLTDIEIKNLEKKTHELRSLCVDTVVWAGSGHIGGSLSAMDILTILYYKYLNIDPSKPLWEDRDRFILSKGHIGVGFAPVLADKGYIDKEQLKEYNHTGSELGMHLDSNKVPGVDASTGSLGHGLPIAVGMALAARINNKDYKTYCLLGDGECDEGSVWEAAMSIAHYKITNLVTIVDRNRCMIDGPTENVMSLEPFAKKWEAFGFIVKEVDGHNFTELSEAIEYALAEDKAPVVIIANTIKGCGIDFMEDNYKWHYGGLNSEKIAQSKESLEKYYKKRVKGA
ncbi:transketolase [Vallitalea guaymasensis]|uniref:Transketolase n=1 Tax=Vallitalea guaymasensis TaxID=1185412 RepID=A0A8J8SDX0_9FIRM|nr:transketolase [Vallitalea guaymasensis]QUH30911.1 transketolase [Vallitalea guaymasensis]